MQPLSPSSSTSGSPIDNSIFDQTDLTSLSQENLDEISPLEVSSGELLGAVGGAAESLDETDRSITMSNLGLSGLGIKTKSSKEIKHKSKLENQEHQYLEKEKKIILEKGPILGHCYYSIRHQYKYLPSFQSALKEENIKHEKEKKHALLKSKNQSKLKLLNNAKIRHMQSFITTLNKIEEEINQTNAKEKPGLSESTEDFLTKTQIICNGQELTADTEIVASCVEANNLQQIQTIVKSCNELKSKVESIKKDSYGFLYNDQVSELNDRINENKKELENLNDQLRSEELKNKEPKKIDSLLSQIHNKYVEIEEIKSSIIIEKALKDFIEKCHYPDYDGSKQELKYLRHQNESCTQDLKHLEKKVEIKSEDLMLMLDQVESRLKSEEKECIYKISDYLEQCSENITVFSDALGVELKRCKKEGFLLERKINAEKAKKLDAISSGNLDLIEACSNEFMKLTKMQKESSRREEIITKILNLLKTVNKYGKLTMADFLSLEHEAEKPKLHHHHRSLHLGHRRLRSTTISEYMSGAYSMMSGGDGTASLDRRQRRKIKPLPLSSSPTGEYMSGAYSMMSGGDGTASLDRRQQRKIKPLPLSSSPTSSSSAPIKKESTDESDSSALETSGMIRSRTRGSSIRHGIVGRLRSLSLKQQPKDDEQSKK